MNETKLNFKCTAKIGPEVGNEERELIDILKETVKQVDKGGHPPPSGG